MRIAQVAPLYESVPPKLYGGTERIVSYLTEELVALGHEVTLFAAGDSKTSALLAPMAPEGLRLAKGIRDPLAYHYFMLEKIVKTICDFDIIHFHVDYLHFAFSRRYDPVNVTTLHGRLDIPEVIRLYEEYEELPLVSVSEAQRKPHPQGRWLATVYHGLPQTLFYLNTKPDPYLAFLGRISPEKRLDRAIQIAELCSLPLKVAAKIDGADKEYYKATIKPLLKHRSSVEFLGEINDKEKQEFVGRATALLFPIDWPEPFGLVMIEAMACGTPVIAFSNGSVPEVLRQGVSGFMVKNVIEAAEVVAQLDTFNRAACRQEFERRFTARRMAEDYVRVFESELARRKMSAKERVHLVREASIRSSSVRRVEPGSVIL